jgi:hypothetical protein
VWQAERATLVPSNRRSRPARVKGRAKKDGIEVPHRGHDRSAGSKARLDSGRP